MKVIASSQSYMYINPISYLCTMKKKNDQKAVKILMEQTDIIFDSTIYGSASVTNTKSSMRKIFSDVIGVPNI